MTVRRRTSTLAITLCAAIAACDAPDPASPAIKGLGVDAHELVTTCVTGATKLVVAVYPTTIAVGGHATPYASVYDINGVALSSRQTQWTIAGHDNRARHGYRLEWAAHPDRAPRRNDPDHWRVWLDHRLEAVDR